MNEDDTDRRVLWVVSTQGTRGWGVRKQNYLDWWSNIQLNGTVNRHNCVYWATENLHVHMNKVVNLPGFTVRCGLSYGSLIGPFFFEGAVTGPMHLNMIRTPILPAVHQLYGNEPFYFQQDGASSHYQDVRSYLDQILPGQCVGLRCSVE
jgi:hypothetical protein